MNESVRSIKDIILEHNYPAKAYTLSFDGQEKVALRTDLGWLTKANFEISNDMNDRSIMIQKVADYIKNASYVPAFNDSEYESAVRYVYDEIENLNFESAVKYLFTRSTSLISNGIDPFQRVELTIGEAIWTLDRTPVYNGTVCFENGIASLRVHFDQKISLVETIKPVTQSDLADPDLMDHLRYPTPDTTRTSMPFARTADGFNTLDTTYPGDNVVTIIRTADDLNPLDRINLADKLNRYYPEQNFIMVDESLRLEGGLDHSDEIATSEDYEHTCNYTELESLSL